MRSCLICDDHGLIRDALATAISGHWPETRILQAENFIDAWAYAESSPDLCLVDLAMPGADPIEGVAGLRLRAPQAKTLIITGSHDDHLMLQLLQTGIEGFIEKTAMPQMIIAAISLVLAGGRYLPPRLAQLAATGILDAAAPDERGKPGRMASNRQREVLQLIALGRSNKEIARELGLSPSTVKTHVAHALASVGASNRTEAAMRAREAGLI